jgi:hypothetical protein
MTPTARKFIQSQASDLDHALVPYRLAGMQPEELVALLLDTGTRIGAHPMPFILLMSRSELARFQHARATGEAIEADTIFGTASDTAANIRATNILLDEAIHLIASPIPPGRMLTIAKVRDELAVMQFRPIGVPPSPPVDVN